MHQFIIQVDQVHVLQLKVEVVGCMVVVTAEQIRSDLPVSSPTLIYRTQSCHHLNTITFSLSMTHTYAVMPIQ